MAVTAMLKEGAHYNYLNPNKSSADTRNNYLMVPVRVLGRGVYAAFSCTVGSVAGVAYHLFEVIRGVVNCNEGSLNKPLYGLWKDGAMLVSVIGLAGFLFSAGPFTYQHIGNASIATFLFSLYSVGVWGEFVVDPDTVAKRPV
jgi:hypothetical protein